MGRARYGRGPGAGNAQAAARAELPLLRSGALVYLPSPARSPSIPLPAIQLNSAVTAMPFPRQIHEGIETLPALAALIDGHD